MSEMCTHRKHFSLSVHPDYFSFFSFFLKFSFSFSLFLLSGLTLHAESFQLQHVTGSLLCSVKKTQPHLNLLKVCVSFNPLHVYGFHRKNFLKFSNFIFNNTGKQLLSGEVAAQELSFYWLHHRFFFLSLKQPPLGCVNSEHEPCTTLFCLYTENN